MTLLTRRSVMAGLIGSCACGSTHAVAADIGKGADGWTLLCGAAGYPTFQDTGDLRPGAPEAIKATRLITDAVGILPNFEVLEARFDDASTAFAAVRRSKRYIVYDRARFSFLNGRTDWISLGIIGHEVGHHLAAHVYTNSRSGKADELEADRFAGFALSRLGADEAQATSWARTMSVSGGTTHPPRKQRIVAARAGWRHGEALKTRERGSCAPAWLDDAVEIGGRTCRMARSCPSGEERIRLACEAYDGRWEWVGGAKK
ncbi:MAG: hypothetical protein AAF416_12195 [Pseudomonadota bacterium]